MDVVDKKIIWKIDKKFQRWTWLKTSSYPDKYNL